MTNRRGFTLIELLVVVLIIGILAAVALPQYNVAVEKARMVQMITVTDALAKAEESFYMANGVYTGDFTALDIEFKGCRVKTDSSIGSCGNFSFDLLSRSDNSAMTVSAVNVPDWQQGGETPILEYIVWLAHSEKPGTRVCAALTGSDVAQRVCQSMEGLPSACQTDTRYTCYYLP